MKTIASILFCIVVIFSFFFRLVTADARAEDGSSAENENTGTEIDLEYKERLEDFAHRFCGLLVNDPAQAAKYMDSMAEFNVRISYTENYQSMMDRDEKWMGLIEDWKEVIEINIKQSAFKSCEVINTQYIWSRQVWASIIYTDVRGPYISWKEELDDIYSMMSLHPYGSITLKMIKFDGTEETISYAVDVRDRIFAMLVLGSLPPENAESASTKGDCPEGMAYIPPGEFLMGTSEADIERLLELYNDEFDRETPQRRVSISKGFCMDKYEVTQGKYKNVMGNNPSYIQHCGLDCPVEGVRWYDAEAYCEKAGKRLPTEAEWEYAARAGTTTDFYSGNMTDDECDDPALDRVGWYCGNSDSSTHRVGGKEPNAWGLYDMLGNVWEWVEDCYDENWYAEMPATNPVNTCTVGVIRVRVLRGDSWYGNAGSMRVSNRRMDYPTYRSHGLGFRCVQDF